MSDQAAIESFTGKWRARWPEWSIAEAFVPHEQRAVALAWAALLQELTDAAWGGSDTRPGEAKLGWWVEELQGWSRGIRRHPLGLLLQRSPASWLGLAQAVPSLRDSRERPIDAGDAYAQLQPLVHAIDAIEKALFQGPSTGTGDAIALSLLHMRVAHHPADAVPLQLLAQAGESAALSAWTRQLAGQAGDRAGSRPRRLWAGLARARLRRGQPVRPLSAGHALWAAWRAARG